MARGAFDAVLAHARDAAPHECCGVLLGVGPRIAQAVRGRNLEAGTTRFLLDPHDHIEARRQARSGHQEVLGFYHSHPHSAAVPSPTDVAEATYPDALSVIVGVREGTVEVRAFRIVGGEVDEVSLEVEGRDPHH